MKRGVLSYLPRCVAVSLALGALVIAGCGVPKGNVSGKVSYQGKPLPSGSISFIGPDDHPVSSAISRDGSYQIAGITAGTAKITVETPWDVAQLQKKKMATLPADAPAFARGMMKVEAIQIPKKYQDPQQSGLTYEVKAGAQVYDLDLP